jgi:hypothetical protein
MSEMGLGGPLDQMDMQLAAAALLADNKDVKMMLRVLGKTLHDSFGDRVEIARAPGGLLHRQPEEVKAITVHLDQDDYQAQLDGHAVQWDQDPQRKPPDRKMARASAQCTPKGSHK